MNGYLGRRGSTPSAWESDDVSVQQPVMATTPSLQPSSSPSKLLQPFPKCLHKPPSNNALGLYMDNLPEYPASAAAAAIAKTPRAPQAPQTAPATMLPPLPIQRHMPLIAQMEYHKRPMMHNRNSGASFMTNGSATSVLLPPSAAPAGLPLPSPFQQRMSPRRKPSYPSPGPPHPALGSVQIGIASRGPEQSPWSARHHVPARMLL